MTPPQSTNEFARRPALDGLRGLAVIAVVLFHFDVIKGGYLGVDFFFVLSGFLITSLLIVEFASTGRVDFRQFWARRVKRLIPALILLLLGAGIYATYLAMPSELPAIRRDGLAGLLYVTNWAQIKGATNYWDHFAIPSILRHLWSLAIEEQFYIVWPLVTAAVFKWSSSPVRALGALSAGGAAVSAGLGTWMYTPGEPTSRMYFGTDTRVGAILLGAFAACLVYVMKESAPRVNTRFGSASMSAARTTAVVTSACLLGYLWISLDGQSSVLWRGGLIASGIASTTLIAIVGSDRTGGLGKIVANPVLRWFGTISYGLYLWHWPVRVALDHSRLPIDGRLLFVLRVAVSLLLATASFYLFEQPIRHYKRSASTTRVLMPVATVLAMVVSGWSVWITTKPRAVTPVFTTTAAVPTDDDASTFTPLIKAGSPVRILILGDSVGVDIGVGLTKLGAIHGFEVANRAIPACPLETESGRSINHEGKFVDDPPDCATVLSRIDEAMSTFKPTIILMTFGRFEDHNHELPDGKVATPCSAAYDGWRHQTWRTILDHAVATNVPVAVTTASYARGFGYNPKDDKQTDCLNRVTRKAVKDAGARLVDLGDWTCPSTDCVMQLEGQTLRPDGLHYGEQMSPVAASWILDQIIEGWRG